MRMQSIILVTLGLLITGLVHAAPPKIALDGYPPEVARQLLQQQENEQSASAKSITPGLKYLISKRRWGAGEKVLIAFNGGTPGLHKAIADTAAEWTKYANIKLDFGYNPQTRSYRQWSSKDSHRVAHIRIGFNHDGYWSAVGTDSMLDQYFPASTASMNFEGFAQSWPQLMPSNWRTVVLHEFGHALGFRHEHQQHVCFPEIRWERGANGEPDVYQIYKAWQDWDPDVVNVNLRPVNLRDVDIASRLNTSSIMYYASPAEIYIRGKESKCFIPKENTSISAEDARGAMLAYPKDPGQAVRIASLSEAEMKKVWMSTAGTFTAAERTAVDRRLASQSNARKPLIYIHIQGQEGMALATTIQSKSIAAGFFAPGIEDVKPKKLKSGPVPEIRYFRDIDEEYALQAADLVKEVTGKEVKMIKNTKLGKGVTRNLVEVWLP